MAGIFIATPALAAILLIMATIWGTFDQIAAGDASPVEINNGIAENRHLASCNNADDALDPTKPRLRDDEAFDVRRDAAEREKTGTGLVCQFNNGDTDLAAKFHKTLPHDELGQVNETAFEALEECIQSGDFDVCEDVPAGDEAGFLANPIAAFAVDMAGPASNALAIPPAFTLDSAELLHTPTTDAACPLIETPPYLTREHAAQLAEGYWMALARDVPFSQYDENEVTKPQQSKHWPRILLGGHAFPPDALCPLANLAGMEGFQEMFGVAMQNDGSVEPLSQLFRANFIGVETGPMISQLLVNNFTFDSLTVTPKQTTFKANLDYMTDYDEWLRIQNGGAAEDMEEKDPTERFIRNARDLATLSFTDTIYTEAFRGALILMEQDAMLMGEGPLSRPGRNGPYAESTRQDGFVTYGLSNVMRLLGTAELAQRSSWYQKWQVHNFVRPEALAGTVHNTLKGHLDVPIHPSLLENAELLDLVAASNAAQNDDGSETYLLSQAVREGSPRHPSYPAGHAVQNGAFATVLKAFVGLDRGQLCFENPVRPDDDGLELLDYTDGCLTFEGEINKLATNVAIGRQMCGVHYRFDSTEGLVLGETVVIRLLHQELMTYPEEHTFEFRLFTGETIELSFDGTFAVDGKTCSGEVYEDVAAC